MKLDFTTVTQERHIELQIKTKDLFTELIDNVQDCSMENINMAVAEWCNTPEELVICSTIVGITLNAWGII